MPWPAPHLTHPTPLSLTPHARPPPFTPHVRPPPLPETSDSMVLPFNSFRPRRRTTTLIKGRIWNPDSVEGPDPGGGEAAGWNPASGSWIRPPSPTWTSGTGIEPASSCSRCSPHPSATGPGPRPSASRAGPGPRPSAIRAAGVRAEHAGGGPLTTVGSAPAPLTSVPTSH